MKKAKRTNALLSLVMIALIFGAYMTANKDATGESSQSFFENYSQQSCNTAIIPINGSIEAYLTQEEYIGDYVSSTDVIDKIDSALSDSNTKYLIFEINSWGGSPFASAEIAAKIKSAPLPTYAWIRSGATSGGYWIASSADTVYASDLSMVGGIGVTSSYIDHSKKNASEGITFNQLSLGEFKDAYHPDKALEPKEEAIIRKNLTTIYQEFISAVKSNRPSTSKPVQELATGETWLGRESLELGLIDKIGGVEDIQNEIRMLSGEPSAACWYADESLFD